MADRYICQACGELFESNSDAFSQTCSACGHRHQPRAGCCSAGSPVSPATTTYRENDEMSIPADCVPAVARKPTSYSSGASMNQPPKIVVNTAAGRLT